MPARTAQGSVPAPTTLEISINKPPDASSTPLLVERDYSNNVLRVPVTVRWGCSAREPRLARKLLTASGVNVLAHPGAVLGLGCLLTVLACDASHHALPDSGSRDSAPDASLRHGGMRDPAVTDASPPDASPPDAGRADANAPDGSRPDTLSDGSFSLRLEGDGMVIVEAHTGLQLLQQSCSGWDPVLEKRAGSDWRPLRDDRHPFWNNPGYFLDGRYVEPSSNLGCDYNECTATFGSGEIRAGYAREYVKTGTRALSSEEEDAGFADVEAVDPADMIETRAFHGPLRVRFKYSLLERCDTSREVALQIEVP
jgi:hypothetical protein